MMNEQQHGNGGGDVATALIAKAGAAARVEPLTSARRNLRNHKMRAPRACMRSTT